MDWLWKSVRINHRVLILLLLFLVLLDQWISHLFINQISSNGVYRMELEDKQVIQDYLEWIKKDPAKKVVFLGDSVIYGTAVKNKMDTIPAHVAQYASRNWPNKEIHFYNVGLKGLGMADAYYLLKLLHNPKDPIDLLVYNLNAGWLNKKQIINRELVLELYPPKEVEWKKLGLAPPVYDENDMLRNNVLSYWKLYHYRSWVNELIFHQNATQTMETLANTVFGRTPPAESEEAYLPWYQKNLDKEFQGVWKQGKIDVEGEQWKYFHLFLGLSKQISKESFVFLTPRNYKLLDLYQRVDYPEWERSKQDLKAVVEKYDIAYADYDTQIESRMFSDSVHLLGKGNELLAKIILDDMDRLKLLSP